MKRFELYEYLSKSDEELGITDEIVFWGQEGDEELSHSCIHDCIEYIIDGCYPNPVEEIQPFEIVGFKRQKAKSTYDPEDLVFQLLESLDEEYAGPDYDLSGETTQKMLDAAKALIKAVEEDYVAWACEEVCIVEVTDPLQWVKENAPHWLETE
jgi:hypothetical protein